MDLNKEQLIKKLEKTYNYLQSDDRQVNYYDLIDTLKSRIDILKQENNQSIEDGFVDRQLQEIIIILEGYFGDRKLTIWRQIKRIKEKELGGQEVKNYQQQIVRKKLKEIASEQQRAINILKQNLRKARQKYLNIFLPDSWMFEVQQLIQSSQAEIVKEYQKEYLYLTVEFSKKKEYFHSYILGLYQEKVTKALEYEWFKVNFEYGDGGLKQILEQTNNKLKNISLIKSCAINYLSVNQDLHPQLKLSEIIDFKCLKTNSRIVFDYNCTQSSWFKLLISLVAGTSIYLITKLYLGEGKYIGFVIVIFQLINLITGQDIKSLKLKQQQKELQRIVSSKYQSLIHLIVEQLIQNTITHLEIANSQYQQELDTIAILLQNKLDLIKQRINDHRTTIDNLEEDLRLIQSWLE